MPLYPTWQDIALRLLLTLLAAAIIGLNRGARGHAAGLRTTILVSLAACVAMIQANILLPIDGRTATSFGVMDLMRLPLGILTGVGFIGAGTILRRGDLVTGVTTAATLWVATVIGLCFGGGQLALGGGATVITVLTLWALVAFDVRIPRDHRALLLIRADLASFSTSHLAELIAPLGCKAVLRKQSVSERSRKARYWFEIAWRQAEAAGPPLELLRLLNERYTVLSFELTSDSHV
ncbi:MAG TPA: MgtC/SapB family protein [Steroidobacteraceae bacterium]|nr:MgtC/SapB family protein [Steroidobacteraceae bacterium]